MNELQQMINDIKANTDTKSQAISALLANVEPVDLEGVCKSLGWFATEKRLYPSQKNYRVAIVSVLQSISENNNWHIIHDAGFFYIYNGAYWVALEDAEVKNLLKRAAIKMQHPEIECRDSSFVDLLFNQIVQEGFFKERNFIKQSIINLKNGSLVIGEKGAKLKPFDHRDFLTHQLDFDHNPDAKNQRFIEYLNVVLPNKDTQKTLQQVAGYLFVKGLKLEKVFFLYGGGANGKSVFFEIINGIIGSENLSNYSLESLTDDKGYSRAMIKDKILNYGTDIRMNHVDAGKFKTLASNEPIEARLPYKNPFMMTDYAKLIFNVNKMDGATVEHTHGFFRRFLVIPFSVTIEESQQDRELHKKILSDRAGVLNWIIEGADEVVKNKNIFISDECEQFKKQFIKETDSVAMFEEQCIKDKPLYKVHYSQIVSFIYASYKEYCIEVNFKPLGRNNFKNRMVAIGFNEKKTEQGILLSKQYEF
jgi:putative DNA primase/helicase